LSSKGGHQAELPDGKKGKSTALTGRFAEPKSMDHNCTDKESNDGAVVIDNGHNDNGNDLEHNNFKDNTCLREEFKEFNIKTPVLHCWISKRIFDLNIPTPIPNCCLTAEQLTPFASTSPSPTQSSQKRQQFVGKDR
jgi:hypothetical protein